MNKIAENDMNASSELYSNNLVLNEDDSAMTTEKTFSPGKRRVSIANEVIIIENRSIQMSEEEIGVGKDKNKVILLIFLYTLQGLPMGKVLSFITSSRK